MYDKHTRELLYIAKMPLFSTKYTTIEIYQQLGSVKNCDEITNIFLCGGVSTRLVRYSTTKYIVRNIIYIWWSERLEKPANVIDVSVYVVSYGCREFAYT